MSSPRRVAITGVGLVDPLGDGPSHWGTSVLFEGDRIREIFPAGADSSESLRRADETVDGGGLWLLPGWVDIQINDIEWLARGVQPPEAHVARIRDVARYQLARGVTGFVLATLAAPEEEILSYLTGMSMVRRQGDGAEPVDAAFLGGLVEGTFMNPAFHGAHNPAHVVPPEIPLLDRFLDTGAVRLVNIAPEMSPGACDVIAHARRRGVVVGIGHARPHGRRVREAVAAGLRYVIHLGNGPTGSSLKGFDEGGLMEEALRNDAIIVTLIVDGVHLNPRLVRDILARKGIGRVIAVSDAGFARGNPEGDFEVFGIRGRVSPDRRYLSVVPAPGSPPPNPLSSESARLFGSAADMRGVFETTLNLLTAELDGIYTRHHEGLSLPAALRQASRLASLNPATLLGEEQRGRLRPGARADAILLRVEGDPGAYRVQVERAWLGGEEITA